MSRDPEPSSASGTPTILGGDLTVAVHDASTRSNRSNPDAPGPGTLAVGARLGRFVVLARLGRGGMGVVYAAYDPELDRNVAIKLLLAGPWSGDLNTAAGKQRGRLRREAQTLARLSHPHVVSVYEVGTVEDGPAAGNLFVAMEYVEGGTLGAWLRADEARSAMRPWRDVVRIFAQAGRALAAAHDAGIVHRDFKPENVMLTKDGHAKVLDFGLAADAPAVGVANETTRDETHAGLAGTPAYMAPERFGGVPCDAAGDQFSFCVALFEALFGQRPFQGDTLAELSVAIMQGEPRMPGQRIDVPRWLQRVVMRGLARDKAARFDSMHALVEELDRDRTVFMRRAAMALLGIGALAGLGFVGWQLTRPGHVNVEVTWNGDPLLGAIVAIDGRPLTPRDNGAFGDIPAGLHELRVVAPGFEPHASAIEIGRGQSRAVVVPLRHAQGTVSLEVEPYGSTILLQGVDRGSRLVELPLDTGRYEVLARRDGHYEQRVAWTLAAGEHRDAFVSLPPARVWHQPSQAHTLAMRWAGDFDGDARQELISQVFNSVSLVDPWRAEILWSQADAGESASMLVDDLDDDGLVDVVGTRTTDGQLRLTRWRPPATAPVWQHTITTALPHATPRGRPIAVRDARDHMRVVIACGPHVVAIDAASGRRLWMRTLDDLVIELAAAPDRVIVAATHGVEALAIADGSRVWIDPRPLDPDRGLWTRPEMQASLRLQRDDRFVLVDRGDDRIGAYVIAGAVEGPTTRELRALDLSTGHPVWTRSRIGVGWAAAYKRVDDDIVVRVGPERTELADAHTGLARWWADDPLVLDRVDDGPIAIEVAASTLTWRDTTTGAVQRRVSLPARSLSGLAIGDPDGDARPEIAVGLDGDRLAIVELDGRVSAIAHNAGAGHIYEISDADGDGFDEMLIDQTGPHVARGPAERWQRNGGGAIRAGPVVADLDGDGALEVAVLGGFGRGGELVVYDAATGRRRGAVARVFAIRSPQTIARIDGGHDLVLHSQNGQGLVRVSGHDLAITRRREVPEAYSRPAVVDLDGDGRLAIVSLPWNGGELVAVDAESFDDRWTAPIPEGGWPQPLLVVHGDDRLLIVLHHHGAVAAYDARTGGARWSESLGHDAFSQDPVTVDLDRDGVPEIVVMQPGRSGDLVALRVTDGAIVDRWAMMGSRGAALVALDLHDDDEPEVFVAMHQVCRLARGGVVRYCANPTRTKAGRESVFGPPVAVDADGDGRIEIASATSDGRVVLFDAATGGVRLSYSAARGHIEGAPALADVDGDGLLELFVTSHDTTVRSVRLPSPRRWQPLPTTRP